MPLVATPRFGNVSDSNWRNRTAYLIGGGPSLRGFDLARLNGETIVAVNDAINSLPNSAALFSIDYKWIQNRKTEIEAFAGERYLAVAEDYQFENAPQATYLLRVRERTGLSENAGRIYMGGGNSGFGAFNVAFLMGFKRIVLLGYDFRAANQHWYESYSWNAGNNGNSQMYLKWAQQFAYALPQLRRHSVEVLNASPNSAIDCFKKISLNELPLREVA